MCVQRERAHANMCITAPVSVHVCAVVAGFKFTKLCKSAHSQNHEGKYINYPDCKPQMTTEAKSRYVNDRLKALRWGFLVAYLIKECSILDKNQSMFTVSFNLEGSNKGKNCLDLMGHEDQALKSSR